MGILIGLGVVLISLICAIAVIAATMHSSQISQRSDNNE